MPTEEESDPEIEFAAIPEGDRKEQIVMVVAYLAEAGIKPTGFSRNEQKRLYLHQSSLLFNQGRGTPNARPGRHPGL